MNQGVFLDRDGVLTKLVFNLESNEYEAPHFIGDLGIIDDVIDSIGRLKKMNYKLFIISNQPDYAKGKTSLEDIKNIENKFKEILEKNNVGLDEYYYCYHHPEGVVAKYSVKCECRKSGTLFLEQAQIKYNLDMQNSWMIGDQDTDIFGGQKAGVKTILIDNPLSKDKRGNSIPDYVTENLSGALKIIELSRKGK